MVRFTVMKFVIYAFLIQFPHLIYLLLARIQISLLYQIAERRKLVSSINSSIIDSEEEKASSDQSGSLFPDTDLAPISDDESAVEGQNGNILSSSYGHSTEQEPVALPSATSRGSNESEREHGKLLHQENVPPKVDSIKRLEVTRSDTDWSEPLPAFLKKAETSILEDEKHIDLKESSLQVDENEENDTVSEDVKPPPLAGPNVMNVILVAAECAPWSKTGILDGDII